MTQETTPTAVSFVDHRGMVLAYSPEGLTSQEREILWDSLVDDAARRNLEPVQDDPDHVDQNGTQFFNLRAVL